MGDLQSRSAASSQWPTAARFDVGPVLASSPHRRRGELLRKLSQELVHCGARETCGESYDATSDYVENYYNTKPRHSVSWEANGGFIRIPAHGQRSLSVLSPFSASGVVLRSLRFARGAASRLPTARCGEVHARRA